MTTRTLFWTVVTRRFMPRGLSTLSSPRVAMPLSRAALACCATRLCLSTPRGKR